MIRGFSNDLLPSSVVSEVSLGRSIHQFISLSSLRMINSEYTAISLNQSAFLPSRMEVSSGRSIHHSRFNPTHFQIPRGDNNSMKIHQTEATSNWASLFITSFFHNHSSTPIKHTRNCNHLHSLFPFRSLPNSYCSQSHTQHNQRRKNNPSSVL